MKLSTDNPDTMPITDAVYGKQASRPDKPARERRPEQLWQRLEVWQLDMLARVFKETRRYAAQRRRGA